MASPTLMTSYSHPLTPHSQPSQTKMVNNCAKTSIFTSCPFKLLLYTQMHFRGQQKVSSHPITWPILPSTPTISHSYSKGHHSHPLVTKNNQKLLKTYIFDFCLLEPLFYTWMCPMDQQKVSSHHITWPMLPFKPVTSYKYPMGYYSHPLMTKNSWNTCFLLLCP